MSTHNIGFYEDLTKIIFELSSNIIKYAPYFFCWTYVSKHLGSLWGKRKMINWLVQFKMIRRVQFWHDLLLFEISA